MATSTLTKSEAIELVDLLDTHVRNARYRELMDKYMNDESAQKVITEARANDSERVVVE